MKNKLDFSIVNTIIYDIYKKYNFDCNLFYEEVILICKETNGGVAYKELLQMNISDYNQIIISLMNVLNKSNKLQ